jgi:hypothetical protein
MNWKQLYTSSTSRERLEAVIQLLYAVEARQSLGRGRGWSNRRRATIAHFINDRRRRTSRSRFVNLVSFTVILYTVSAAVILVIYNAPLSLAIPALSIYSAGIMALLLRPFLRYLKPHSHVPES